MMYVKKCDGHPLIVDYNPGPSDYMAGPFQTECSAQAWVRTYKLNKISDNLKIGAWVFAGILLVAAIGQLL